MSQDDGGLIGFFFYTFIVYPVTSWLLKSKGNRGLFLAVGFLAFIACGKTAIDISERGPNYYSTLYVPSTTGFDEIIISRSSTPIEIRKAWKKKSLELHPDKNKSPEASVEFERVKQAYDVLINPETRGIYNKFGPSGLQRNQSSVIDGNEILIEIVIYHISWAILVFILTLGKSTNNSRNYIYCGQIAILVIEVSLTLQDVTLPEWFLPTITEYEIILILHSIFPAFMNGCKIIGSFYYIDIDELTKNTLLKLQNSHEEILSSIKSIQAQLDELKTGGGNITTGGGTSLVQPNIGDRINKLSPQNNEVEQSKMQTPMNNDQNHANSNQFAVVALVAYIVYYTWSQ
mmetsp:Transcript_11746/g.15130  ORF Transcript_11746/g.15130 Transcript_11746/m.15130 type:complete len:346 (-) Transcript_11746:142-1179(-)